jgi:uncharacterized membrane protein
VILVFQALLALAYTVLAHLSSAYDRPGLAAVALALLALMLLLAPLLRWRGWAWLALPLLWLGVVVLYCDGLIRAPMLLVPVAFVALVAWWFGRSLRSGRVALITRIVSRLDDIAPARMAPELLRYTRTLTAAWAWLLAALALVNLVLALVAVPDGLLATLGLRSPLPVTRTQWSWFANICNYGIVGGFFVIEYQFRKRRFPGRYDSFLGFVRKLAALGPAFWRDFLKP